MCELDIIPASVDLVTGTGEGSPLAIGKVGLDRYCTGFRLLGAGTESSWGTAQIDLEDRTQSLPDG